MLPLRYFFCRRIGEILVKKGKRKIYIYLEEAF